MIRRFALAWAVAIAACLAMPALVEAAPQPVSAWYMYGTDLDGMKAEALAHGQQFAKQHPGGNRLMLLDFGAARKLGSSTWGTISFGGYQISNPNILTVLKCAADGVHKAYTKGFTTIAYGDSNYHMASNGMSQSDAYYAGYYQSARAQDLATYQASKGYSMQGTAVASDTEPSWETAAMSKKLVDGVKDQGWALVYDFGSADGCPSSGSGGLCNNGWTVADVAYVSYSGSAVPLPEIYYTVNSDQWTVIKHWWDSNKASAYLFWGTTAEIAPDVLSPAQGWNALNARNPSSVLAETVCFGL